MFLYAFYSESPEDEIVVEETIAPVTANLLGSESNPGKMSKTNTCIFKSV